MRYIQDGRIYLTGSEGEVPAGVNLDRDFVQLPAVEFEIVNIARGVVHVFKLDAMGKRRVFELRWSNPAVKDILARLRDSQTSPVRWAIPSFWATEEYFRHLNGEWKKNVANPQTGRVRSMWVLRSRRWPNHLFDCECMQIACALYNGILKTIDDNISAGKILLEKKRADLLNT